MTKRARPTPPTPTRARYGVEFFTLSELPPPPANPRRHRTTALRSKLRRFGYVRLVVALAAPLRVIAGNGVHAALVAMRDAGEAPPAGVERDGNDWRIPVRVVDLGERDGTAYLVADNEDHGTWDPPGFLELLAELARDDALDATGYDRGEVLALAESTLVDGKSATTPDDFDEREHTRTITLVFDVPTYTEIVKAFAHASRVLGVSGYSAIVRALLAKVGNR